MAVPSPQEESRGEQQSAHLHKEQKMSKNELIDIRMAEQEAFVVMAGQKGVTKEMKAKLDELSKMIAEVRKQVVIEDM